MSSGRSSDSLSGGAFASVIPQVSSIIKEQFWQLARVLYPWPLLFFCCPVMNTWSSYLARRAIQSIFILWAISLVAFMIMHLAPGGPITIYEDPSVDQATLEAIRASLGLDEPIFVQYTRWLRSTLQGNLGRSFIDSRPVLEKILERLPATIQLNLAAKLIGLIGIPIGLYAATHHNAFADHLLRTVLAIGTAAPSWWVGLMILIFFATPTSWLPLGGMYTIGKQTDLLDRLWHLILPAVVLAISDWVMWSRYVRSEVLEVLQHDYVLVARAKGLTERLVLSRHVFRNAMIPVVTILGESIAIMISGSVAVETVFSWPGIGRLAFTAATQRDYPLLMGLTIITSSLVIVGNLLADIAYTRVDPRVKLD